MSKYFLLKGAVAFKQFVDLDSMPLCAGDDRTGQGGIKCSA